MSESTTELPDKEYLYGRYQQYGDKRADMDLKNREWQSQLHKQLSHKALDEPMMDDEMGDIYAPKTVTNTGISPKALLGLAAIGLPFLGAGGVGIGMLLNQWMNVMPDENPEPPPVVQQPHEHSDRDTITIPKLDWGPERP